MTSTGNVSKTHTENKLDTADVETLCGESAECQRSRGPDERNESDCANIAEMKERIMSPGTGDSRQIETA